MGIAGLLAILVCVFVPSRAFGQAQGWQADQDGSHFKLYDVASVEVDSVTTPADACLTAPTAIVFTPNLITTNVSVERADQSGSGGMTVSCDNAAGFLSLIASGNELNMTATDRDNGGDTFSGVSYFGVRSDTTRTFPGNTDLQKFYSSLESTYEFSSHADFVDLSGTQALDSYYWRGQNVGVNSALGNNTRPDGVSWFTFDTPTLTDLGGSFIANSFETMEIRGVPASASPAYGLRIYGGSSDLSERVAGTIVADGLSGGGTLCVQVDNTGKFTTAAGPCASGSGTVTTVTGTAPIFITSTPTTTPNVTIQGAIVSGSTSTTAQNLGSIATSMLACSTSGGVCTVDGVSVGGGLNFNTGTATETLGSFACGSNTFVSSSSTGGLACTQPAFANLSGSATCAQLPALTGSATSSAGSCATKVVAANDGSGTAWPTSGTWANNQAMITSGGNWTTTNECNVFSSCSAGGGLSGTYPNPTVASVACAALPALTGDTTSTAGTCATVTSALHDGASAQFVTTGTWSTGHFLTTGTGTILNTVPTSLLNPTSFSNFAYFGAPPGSGWLIAGNNSTSTSTFGGSAVEYPLGQTASTCELRCVNGLNTGTGYTNMVLTVTRNGSATACTVSIPASSGTVKFDSGSHALTSSAATDIYGLELTYTGATSTGGVTDFTCTAVIQ